MFSFARTLPISLLVVIASTLTSAQLIFTTTAIPSGDVASHSIVSADFNNDGILDLVTINDHTLSFYKGLGGGTYARPVNQPLPPNLGQLFRELVVAADFSRHGTPDLAIASPSGSDREQQRHV